MLSLLHSFFFCCFADHRDLHSFPTRRSSDLQMQSLAPVVRANIVFESSRKAMNTSLPLFIPDTSIKKGSDVFIRSEEHTSELQSRPHLVCRLLLEKKNNDNAPFDILDQLHRG